jgi:hypothetical protein
MLENVIVIKKNDTLAEIFMYMYIIESKEMRIKMINTLLSSKLW